MLVFPYLDQGKQLAPVAEFITVAVFNLPHEYAVVKARLESEGIPCFAKDERTVLYSNVNSGIKLQVPNTDVEEALEILTEAGIDTVDGVEALYAREPWLEAMRDRAYDTLAPRTRMFVAIGVILFGLLVLWLRS